jgi:hypothetical protein
MPTAIVEPQQMEMAIAAPSRPRLRAGRRPRADSLPEFTHYRDDGCSVSPSCLTCPLPRCRYEEPGGLRAVLNEYRDRQIVELRRRGAPVPELAERFGVSRRTVFRVIENANRRPPAGPVQLRPRITMRKEAHCA